MRSVAPPSVRREDEREARLRPKYRANRWPLRAFTAAVAVGLLVALVLARRATQPDYTQLPSPALGKAAPVSASSATAVSSSSPASTSASSSAPSPTTVPAFAPSRPIQIYVPNPSPDLVISTSVQPLGGCQSVIDPPRNGPGWAGVFGCTDFAQPGTSTPSLAVVAGHSSASLDTVFNKLYRQGAALEKQMVYLRTQGSGDRWLAYRVEHTYIPAKDELPYMTSVWGGDGSSTAGRLVLVTCQQTDQNAPSAANFVAVAQFVGVQ